MNISETRARIDNIIKGEQTAIITSPALPFPVCLNHIGKVWTMMIEVEGIRMKTSCGKTLIVDDHDGNILIGCADPVADGYKLHGWVEFDPSSDFEVKGVPL